MYHKHETLEAQASQSADLSSWASNRTTVGSSPLMSPRRSEPPRPGARSEKLRALPPVAVACAGVEPDVLLRQLDELRQRVLSAYPRPQAGSPTSARGHHGDLNLMEVGKAVKPPETPNRRALLSPPDVQAAGHMALPGSVMISCSPISDLQTQTVNKGLPLSQLTEEQFRAMIRDELRLELAALRDLKIELDALKEMQRFHPPPLVKRRSGRSRPGSRERVEAAEERGRSSRTSSRERMDGRSSRTSSRERANGRRQSSPAAMARAQTQAKQAHSSEHECCASEVTEHEAQRHCESKVSPAAVARQYLGDSELAVATQVHRAGDEETHGTSTPGSQSSASHGRTHHASRVTVGPHLVRGSRQKRSGSPHKSKGIGYRNRDRGGQSRRLTRLRQGVASSEDECLRSLSSESNGPDTEVDSSVHSFRGGGSSPMLGMLGGDGKNLVKSGSGTNLQGIHELQSDSTPTAANAPAISLNPARLNGGAPDESPAWHKGVVANSRRAMFSGPPSPASERASQDKETREPPPQAHVASHDPEAGGGPKEER